jgi:cyanophycinase
MRRPLCLLVLLAAIAQAGPYGKVTKGNGWQYTRLGNPNDVVTATRLGVLFEGGGIDVDTAYQWMCEKANGGDLLVIRASGTADYNPYLYGLCPSLNSVATLGIYSRTGAEQPFVKDTILKAEALFIAGGDQSQYVKFYQNTPVADAINTLAARGVPIGGTSAGNAVLAQFGYSGITGSVTSAQALSNPFSPLITIENGLFNLSPLLADKITDDHFVTRNRMGRLITFMARIIQDGNASQVSAIASNEQTAFLMEPDGSGTIAGTSMVYFLRTPGPPEICQPRTPLTFKNISVYRIRAGDTFNIQTWTGTGGAAYTISAVAGVLQSTQPGGGIY